MSKNACIWTPGVNKDLSGRASALHSDLVEYTGDRPVANAIWAVTRVEGALDKSQLEMDENGEPTIESLAKVIPIKDIVKKTSLSVEKKEIGAIDKQGKPIAYDSLDETLVITKEFNENNPDLIAYPIEQDKKFFINVEYKSKTNYNKAQEAAFNNELNNSLLGIMRSLGFTATVDNRVAGIFDPMNAMETADGLKAVIRVCNGELGEEAFPEEFSHFMIEGLQDHPLVQRILNSLGTEEAQRRVLGEDYDKYVALYTEDDRVDTLRMQKEAAGKLLQRYITQGELMDSPAPQTLFDRLWNFIKKLFSKTKVSDIDRVINEANNNTAQLASMIKDESIFPYFNKIKVLDGKALYKATEEVNRMQAIAEEGLEIASRRLKIIQSRSKDSTYSKKDMETIKNIQSLIEKKKYASSSLAFLKDTLQQLQHISDRLETLGKDVSASDMARLNGLAKVLRQIKEFSDGYTDIVSTMLRLPYLAKKGEVELTEEDANSIAKEAGEVFSFINNLKGNYAELRYRVVYEFLKIYWGEDKVWDIGKNKGKKLTLAHIMDIADRDLNGLDRWISSLSDASDPYLSLIDKSVKVARANRDVHLETILARVRAAHRELLNAGETTDFMYERDENGVPTGYIISNINFAQYNKDRKEYIESLKKQNLKYWQVKSRLEMWDNKHTVKDANGVVVPRGLKEGDKYYIDRLSKLSPAQKKYYDAMMAQKAELDAMLPTRYASTYNAVQIRSDLIEGLSQSTNPVAAVKMIIGNAADNFLKRADDTEFGEDVKGEESKGKEKNVTLDFSSNPIRKLPVYFTRKLEDMSRLSTDFTGSMLAYAGMAVDYKEMNKIIDVLELARDLAHDRDVQQFSGDQKMKEAFTVMRKKFSRAYTKKGGRIAERLDDYMDAVVYGRAKRTEGTVKIMDKEVDVAKLIDTIKSYTGAVGLGLNAFSAMSNVTVGKMQLFIDACAGEYFGLKNSLTGMKNYYALIREYLGELNSTSKSSKLGLLIDKYDALEEFFQNMRMQGKFKGSFSRIMQGTNLYILNSLGEHYLHSRTMLAILDRKKVKVNGKETSLFDAWKVKTIKDDKGNPITSKLVLVDGTRDLDGNELFTEKMDDELSKLLKIPEKDRTTEQMDRIEDLKEIQRKTNDFNIDIKLQIGKVNQSLNGAFNETDKGAIHKFALGRMAMQFRQWMPAHYSRRFASAYYDAQLGEFREGYYRTLGRFSLELLQDLRHAKFQLATRWSKLSIKERRNLYRAFTELSAFALLSVLCAMCGHWKDKENNWGERFVLYNLKRMKMETGASIPWPLSPDFISNIWTILQSPAASMKTMEGISNLLEFQNMFVELQSGRYKGWSKWERDFVTAIPLYGQIRKVFDLSTEDYMFNIFDK